MRPSFWIELLRTLIALILIILIIMLFWAIGLNHYREGKTSSNGAFTRVLM